jgi:hypothetical protein
MRRYALLLQFKKLPRNLENLAKGVLSCKVCFFPPLYTFCSQHCMFRLLSDLEDALAWK